MELADIADLGAWCKEHIKEESSIEDPRAVLGVSTKNPLLEIACRFESGQGHHCRRVYETLQRM